MSLFHFTFMAVVGAALSQATDPVTLRDHAIASSAAPTYLDGAEWSAVNVGGASAAAAPLAATVPGDILTDLQKAKRAPDPLLEHHLARAGVRGDVVRPVAHTSYVAQEPANSE